jgi:hypothetical protein
VLDFGRGVAAVKGSLAILPLRCRAGAACVGTILLQGARASAANAPKAQKRVVYGRGKVNISAGKTRRIKINLSKAGRTLVRKRKNAKVYAKMTYRGGKTARHRITLKR